MLAPTRRAAPVMSAAWPVSASRAGRTGTEADISCVMGPDYDRIGDALNPAAPVAGGGAPQRRGRSEEHTSELQSQSNLVCRLLLEKKNNAARRCAHRLITH